MPTALQTGGRSCFTSVIRSGLLPSTPSISAICCCTICRSSPAIPTFSPNIIGAFAMYWSTSIRTPMSRSICGCACWRWRGAEIGNILRFESDFPGATIIRLEENYRSTSRILGAAAGMIAHNRGRLGKTLWTQAGEGDKVVVRALWDAEDEARWVGDEIEALQRKGHALSEIAILVRAG